jgi:hypothetical protein
MVKPGKTMTKAISTGVRASSCAAWRTSLDDIDAQRLALKPELVQMENARDDTFKAADDLTLSLPRDEYLAIAAKLESIAAEMRADITELAARWQHLHGHHQRSPSWPTCARWLLFRRRF